MNEFNFKVTCVNIIQFCFSGDNLETLELTEQTVNPGQPKTGPQDFELLKLLGKGGYGKVSNPVLNIKMNVDILIERIDLNQCNN